MNTSDYQQVLKRIRAEYLEMPGMRLKIQQVQRLCGLDHSTCIRVLDSLVETKFLCVKSDGTYARLTDCERLRPVARQTELQPKAFLTSS